MDLSRCRRAWEGNDSVASPLTERVTDTEQRGRIPFDPVHQTLTTTAFFPEGRTLPSLSSVFESNALGSPQSHPSTVHNSNGPYASGNKPSTPSNQGSKRPRLSLDQDWSPGPGTSSDRALTTVSVSSQTYLSWNFIDDQDHR
jgi:hypothetical protein